MCCSFKDSSLAMPEIIHEYNSLLGSDPDELCDLVLRVINDQRLRQKLAKNGLRL